MMRQLFVIVLISTIALCAPTEEKPRVPKPIPQTQQQQSLSKRDTDHSTSPRPGDIHHPADHPRPARDTEEKKNDDRIPPPPASPIPGQIPNRPTRDTQEKPKIDQHPAALAKDSPKPLLKSATTTSSDDKSDKH